MNRKDIIATNKYIYRYKITSNGIEVKKLPYIMSLDKNNKRVYKAFSTKSIQFYDTTYLRPDDFNVIKQNRLYLRKRDDKKAKEIIASHFDRRIRELNNELCTCIDNQNKLLSEDIKEVHNNFYDVKK